MEYLLENRVAHLNGGEPPPQCDQPGFGGIWMDDAMNELGGNGGVHMNQTDTGYYAPSTPPTPLTQAPPGWLWKELHSSDTINLMDELVDQHYVMSSATSPVNYEVVSVGRESERAKNLQGESSQMKQAERTELENCVGPDLCNVLTHVDAQPTLDTIQASFHPTYTMYEEPSLSSRRENFPHRGVMPHTNSEEQQQLQKRKMSLPTMHFSTLTPQTSAGSASPSNMIVPTHRRLARSSLGGWPPSQQMDISARAPGYMPMQQQNISIYQQNHVRSASYQRLPHEQPIGSPYEIHNRSDLKCRNGAVMSDTWLTPQNADVSNELMPFLVECKSRAIVLWNIEWLTSADLRSMCEAYGDIFYFRDEFRDIGKDVVFFAYYDLRSAVSANVGLWHDIAKLWGQKQDRGVMHHRLNFMIPLHSITICRDDSIWLQRVESLDGTPFPSFISESEAVSICREFGSLLATYPVTGGTLVDFFDTREAHAALSMLGSDGPIHRAGGIVAVAAHRSDSAHNLGRKLLALLDRWKATAATDAAHVPALVGLPPIVVSPGPNTSSSHPVQLFGSQTDFPLNSEPLSEELPAWCVGPTTVVPRLDQALERINSLEQRSRKVSFHNSPTPMNHSVYPVDSIEEIRSVRSSRTYSDTVLQSMMQPTAPNCGYHSHPTAPARTRCSTLDSSPSGTPGSHPLPTCRSLCDYFCSVAGGDKGGGGSLELDVEKINAGMDKRTTIMIRNIPNKYTQVMLLSEIDVEFRETYDFFYLPIDFKNLCNVGYAFINFMDFRSIIPFWNKFNGQRWHNFNSEKVCSISYARIQGKASMTSRFQNSSLMDRDDEYRPLLFFSSGPSKGRPEPFPPKDKHDSKDTQKSNRSRRASGDSAASPKWGH